MCAFIESFPSIVASKTSSGSVQFDDDLEIPGCPPMPISSVPAALLDLSNPFSTALRENGQSFMNSNGILINTFEVFKAHVLEAHNGGRKELDGLAPHTPSDDFWPCEFEKRESSTCLTWLDDQPEGSVIYVSFGSRLALSKEQMKELGNGLLISGCRFL